MSSKLHMGMSCLLTRPQPGPARTKPGAGMGLSGPAGIPEFMGAGLRAERSVGEYLLLAMRLMPDGEGTSVLDVLLIVLIAAVTVVGGLA